MNITLIEILKLQGKTVDDITKVYRGKDHWCRCGCGGKYFRSEDKGFIRAINEMNKDDFSCYDVEYGGNYINIPYNAGADKCFCVYFN